jgi:hypothetical protein
MKFLVYVCLFSMLYLPEFFGLIRLEDVVISFAIGWLLISKNKRFKIGIIEVTIFTIYLLLISVSGLYNLQFFNQSEAYNFYLDENGKNFIKEVIRAFKYLMIVLLIRNIEFTKEEVFRFLKAFVWLSFGVSIIGIFQYFNIGNIQEIITNYYKQGSVHNTLFSKSYYEMGLVRINSTFYISNIYAAFLLIPAAYALKLILFDKQKKYWIPFMFITLNIIMTQSRTGVILLLGIILLYFFYATFIRRVMSFRMLILLWIMPLLTYVAISMLDMNRIVTRLFLVFQEGFIQSSGRDFVVHQAENILSQSPFLGYSPFVVTQLPADSELKIFIQYGGVLGLLFYLSFLLVLFVVIKRSIIDSNIKVFMYTLLICGILTGLTNGYIMSNRLFPVFLLILCLLSLHLKSDEQRCKTGNTT